MAHLFKIIWHLPRRLMMGLISVYQKTLSPDHSFWGKWMRPQGYCKFQPSCSEYSKQAYEKYGFFRGTFKMIWRIMRCNPWNDGGEDRP
jgi:putative membrane protein insertion efficiency factor